MKIEVLYPELCNLFADNANVAYLRRCLPQAEFVETSRTAVPLFVSERPALIYLGSMTESAQEKVIRAPRPYRQRLLELIEDGAVVLATGNSLEVFGQCIENEDGSKIEGLGIFPTTARRRMFKRYNGLVLGRFEGMKIVGFKSQFSDSVGDVSAYPFIEVIRGRGLYEGCPFEGLKWNNFMGTYLLGPFLVMNPPFTQYLMRLISAEEFALPFQEVAMRAYEDRVREFEDPRRKVHL